MKFRTLKKKDYKKVINYAIEGMHFDWYMTNKFALKAYGRYFLYEALNRATQVIAAYEGKELAGVLIAEIDGQNPVQKSFLKGLYVNIFEAFQKLVAKDSAGVYGKVNKKMLKEYRSKVDLDGEIIFLAANPEIKGKGTGTILLEELANREQGKRVYLFTDNACTYQFYDKRGFDRVAEEEVVLKVIKGEVELGCYLYSKVL